jgi:MinD-like ATPase involved in chromosome partitioning or flagellar assembly
MPDQAQKLRTLTSSAPPPASNELLRPPLVVIVGGRTGVGTTTVAINLAAALADADLRVIAMDAAAGDSNLIATAGVTPAEADLFTDVLSGKRSLASALEPGPAGALLLGNRSGNRGALDFSRRQQRRLLALLQSSAAETDCAIVDAGNGLTHATRRLWQRASAVLVVTTTEDDAIVDSYATIKRARAAGLACEPWLVVNQHDTTKQAERIHGRLSAACENFLGGPLRAAPALPRHRPSTPGSASSFPRVWESPNTPFGHAVLWLGRSVAELLQSVSDETSNARRRGGPNRHGESFV